MRKPVRKPPQRLTAVELAVRDICELPAAPEDDPDTVRIDIRDVKAILDRHFGTGPADRIAILEQRVDALTLRLGFAGEV